MFLVRLILTGMMVFLAACALPVQAPQSDADIDADQSGIVRCLPGCELEQETEFTNGVPPSWCTAWAPNARETCRRDEAGNVVCRSQFWRAEVGEYLPDFPRCTEVDTKILQDPASSASWNEFHPDLVKNGRSTGIAGYGRSCRCEISAKLYAYAPGKVRQSKQPDWCLIAHDGCSFTEAVVAGVVCTKPAKRAECWVILGKKEAPPPEQAPFLPQD